MMCQRMTPTAFLCEECRPVADKNDPTLYGRLVAAKEVIRTHGKCRKGCRMRQDSSAGCSCTCARELALGTK